jgi:hypothetical protein
MKTSRQTQLWSIAGAVAFALITMIAGYRAIGLPPVVIVGGSSVVALVFWIRTYLRKAARARGDPAGMVFAFIGPTLYSLTALGLYYRVPLAGFLAWFIFIGPGVAEFTHCIFPLLRPALQPELPATISGTVSNGGFVAGMPNYWVHVTGVYYFPGLYTAVLPMIPGIWAIRRVLRAARSPERLGGVTRVVPAASG